MVARKLSAGGESLLAKLKSQRNVKQKQSRNACKAKPSLPELDGAGEPHIQGSSAMPSVQLPSLYPSQMPVGQCNDGKLLKPISNLDFATEEMRCFAETIQKVSFVIRD